MLDREIVRIFFLHFRFFFHHFNHGRGSRPALEFLLQGHKLLFRSYHVHFHASIAQVLRVSSQS